MTNAQGQANASWAGIEHRRKRRFVWYGALLSLHPTPLGVPVLAVRESLGMSLNDSEVPDLAL